MNTTKRKRVIVAMSGGVDSSVAAAILKKQGYDVIGIFMKLWSPSAKATGDKAENICCSVEAATAARAVASKLGIPFYVVNFQEEFKKKVVDYYIKEYESGRTPNPCVICNRDIKGEILLQKAKDIDGDFLATGHYARIRKSEVGSRRSDKYYLYTANDKDKDQTYFLWTLTQEQLSHLLFPIGDLTKAEVRNLAKKWHLPSAERKESQGICFIPDRDVSGFLRRYAKKLTKPGSILDIKGNKLGIHDGLINYTIGQRERLGLGGPKANFVVKLESKTNTLVVGDEKDLYSKDLFATDLNWISLINNRQPPINNNIKAKIRYRHPAENCRLSIVDCKLLVNFKKPQRAITPGQSIVFYERGEVLGGGIIK